jgi:hypothetical protein
MQYIIRDFIEATGQISVEYDGKWTYAIDLPIENGAYPVGERLEEIIQGMAPNWLAERETALASAPANADTIRALVQPLPAVEKTSLPTLSETAFESDIEFIKDVVNEVLTAKGL